MFENFYLRLVVAGLLSWFVRTYLISEAAPFIRFVVAGWGVSDRWIKRMFGLFIDPVMSAGSLAIFILSYLRIRPPYGQSAAVLISLAVSYFFAILVLAAYLEIREARKSGALFEWWSYLAQSGKVLLRLVVQIHLFLIELVVSLVGAVARAVLSVIEIEQFEQIVDGATRQLTDRFRHIGVDAQLLIRMSGVSGALIIVVLTFAYWIIGISSGELYKFIQFSLYLLGVHFLFMLVFSGMRRPEAAQLRWINPFAMAGSFVITFTFYVAILRGRPEGHVPSYLVTIGAFIIVLWYACYLSRREVTIEEGKNATGSDDRDFQTDTAYHSVGYFYLFVARFQPLFLAVGLGRAGSEAVANLGGPMTYSWLRALLVAVVAMLVSGSTYLAIWARNIGKAELTYDENGDIKRLAGTEGRDDYPAYRDQLAASALPYCIFIPAMVFGLLSILGRSQITIAGMSGLWLDVLAYGLLAIVLFGLFVQVPYRSGSMERLRPQYEAQQELRRKIEQKIAAAYEGGPGGRSGALEVIAGEMTLRRLKDVHRDQRSRHIYRFNMLGESISSTDALAFIRGLIVTAIAAGAGVLLNELFRVPPSP